MSDLDQDIDANEESEPQATDWPSPGQKLKVLREEIGLSHARVAQALHMTAHYVNALETDEYDKLPGKTFVKGYFKAYAKLLGADVDEIMTCYEQYVAAVEESVESEANVRRAKKAYDQNLRWMICAAVIIILIVGISWWLSKKEDTTAGIENEIDNNDVSVELVQQTDASTDAVIGQLPARSSQPVTAEALIASIEEMNPDASHSADNINLPQHDVILSEDISLIEFENDVTLDVTLDVALDEPAIGASDSLSQQIDQESNEVASAPDLATAETINEEQEESTLLAEATLATEKLLSEETVIQNNNFRQVNLENEGEDLLEVHFKGESWIEVDEQAGGENGEGIRLYNDMLHAGDELNIKGMAPFNILIGNASVVEMSFNSTNVDVTARIRSDNSARILLQADESEDSEDRQDSR